MLTSRPTFTSKGMVVAAMFGALLSCAVFALPLVRQRFFRPGVAKQPAVTGNVGLRTMPGPLVASAPQPQTGAQFNLSRNVFGGGGGTSTNGEIRLDGTIGQATAGTQMTGGQFSVTGGFWQPEANATLPPTPTPTPSPTPSASPLLQFNSSVYLVNEGGGSATITVTRTGNTGVSSSVDYQTADTDTFTVGCATKQGQAYGRCDFATVVGTLSFAAGETSRNFAVPVIDDSYAEGTETFSVILSNPVNAALGSPSSAIISISDNESADGPNPILLGSDPGIDFFVRQHYLDFLGREPEPGQPWSNVLRNCADQFNTNASAPSAGCDRITVSGAFFGSPEYRDKGIYIIDFYRVALNRLPTYVEFSQGLASITGSTAAETNAKRAAFATNFTQRTEFAGMYGGMSNTTFVNALMSGNTSQGGLGQNYNLTAITTADPANPDGATKVTLTTSDLINRVNGATMTRAQVLRAMVQSDQITQNFEALNAFVASQYYGYLRRTPDAGGFNGWVNYLRNNPSDFRTMVHGFVNSIEYRLRLGPS